MVNLNAKATYNLDKIIGAKESQKLLINVQRLQEHCPHESCIKGYWINSYNRYYQCAANLGRNITGTLHKVKYKPLTYASSKQGDLSLKSHMQQILSWLIKKIHQALPFFIFTEKIMIF